MINRELNPDPFQSAIQNLKSKIKVIDHVENLYAVI